MDYAELKILIETETAEIGAFLVDFELNMENQIKLHADLLEGHISVDQLKYLSRSIENALGDESEDYSIEVSSPGMFTPFKVPEQYKKSIGRLVKVNILESGDSLKGTLKSYDGKEIELHWTERVPKPKGKGKMDVDLKKTIPLKDVSKIILDFKF
jgi:ribosome maturation factor RimP|tara:strand:- start:11 stop:478 length:468 start_codon:yes stop_codon:yes gene_type:complete